jgi:peroxiredoxin
MLRKKPKDVAVALLIGVLAALAGVGIASAGGHYDDHFKDFGVQKPRKEIKAPDFTLKDQDGKNVRLSDYKGKVVHLIFFTTWCDSCRVEMPKVSKVYTKFSDRGFVILGVGISEKVKRIKEFREELELSFLLVADEDGAVSRTYGVRGIPTSYLIDREGYVIGGWVGGRDWEGRVAYGLMEALLETSKKN